MKETILITGSSRGIGRATALSFFDENLNIVINYIKAENPYSIKKLTELKNIWNYFYFSLQEV